MSTVNQPLFPSFIILNYLKVTISAIPVSDFSLYAHPHARVLQLEKHLTSIVSECHLRHILLRYYA